MAKYLLRTKNTWHHILGPLEASEGVLDDFTVFDLQGRSPLHSSEDYDYIHERIRSRSIFQRVASDEDRSQIWQRIRTIPHTITSLHTFLEDTKYLEPCAKILKKLLPSGFKGTVHQAFVKRHNGQRDALLQTSELASTSVTMPIMDCVDVAYKQLWLFAMRHFPSMSGVQPRKDNGKRNRTLAGAEGDWWHNFAGLAFTNGFQSKEIDLLRAENPDERLAREFLLKARPRESYYVNESAFNEDIRHICRMLSAAKPKSDQPSIPELSSDYHRALDRSERCGRPFADAQESDRRFLFINIIYNEAWEHAGTGQWEALRRRNLTSLAVKRDTFRAFFGACRLTSLSTQGTELNEGARRALQNNTNEHTSPPTEFSFPGEAGQRFHGPQSSRLNDDRGSEEVYFWTIQSLSPSIDQLGDIGRRSSTGMSCKACSTGYVAKGLLPHDMLPSRFIRNFFGTAISDGPHVVLFYNADTAEFHCVPADENATTAFVGHIENTFFYCPDKLERLGVVGIKDMYQTAMQSRQVVIMKRVDKGFGHRNISLEDLDVLVASEALCETNDSRTPFLCSRCI